MSRVKFTINEIITIIIALTKGLEASEIYGEPQIEEIYLPKPIEEKLKFLEEQEYKNFIEKATIIAEEVYELKSGELNELNFLHQEIKILSQTVLKKYLD